MTRVRTSMTAVFFGVICLLPGSNVRGADDDKRSLPEGTLSGRVIDPDGRAVTGARIWMYTWESKLLGEARSDSDGRFRLGPVEPVYRRRFPILIEADGYARQYLHEGSYSIFPGADSDLGEIRLARGRVFTGQVIDVDGTPYPGGNVIAQVDIHELGHTVGGIGPDYELTTDSDGRYRTPPLPVGDLGVWTQIPNRQLAYIGCPVAPGGEQVLKTLHLQRDVPIVGVVSDQLGHPIAGAEINANSGCHTTSDEQGKFTLHGFGPKPWFQFQVRKDHFVFVNWGVNVEDDGIHWHEVGDSIAKGATKQLVVTMASEALIEARATDAETGEPVRVDKVLLCLFQRKSGGEVVLSGCRSPKFEQPEPGRLSIPYSLPEEYHLTVSAAGYYDGEAFTPKVLTQQPIAGIEIKMKKKREGAVPDVPEQTVSGSVTRHGKPITTGWIGSWHLRRQDDAVNAYMLRGRTVEGDPVVYESAPIHDGKFKLNVPFQDEHWYVAAEEAGHPLTLVGPIKIKLNEKKHLDIECTDGGSIHGRVKNVPAGWEGNLWAVAFTKTAIRAETRVNPDGTFSFRNCRSANMVSRSGTTPITIGKFPAAFSICLVRFG